MATTYIMGHGSTLSVSPNTNTFTVIQQIKSISYSGDQATYDSTTNMSSPSAVPGGPPVAEYAPGILEPGTAQAQGVFNPLGDPGQIILAAAKLSQVPVQVQMQMAPVGTQKTGLLIAFTAFVQECYAPTDIQTDKASTFSVTFKLTGPKVVTYGS